MSSTEGAHGYARFGWGGAGGGLPPLFFDHTRTARTGLRFPTTSREKPHGKDHLEIILEDINGKFDLVLEGHETLRLQIEKVGEESKERDGHLLFLIQTLNTKIDRVDARLDTKIDEQTARLETKIDGVARDLADHRRNTEVHGPVYGVKEP